MFERSLVHCDVASALSLGKRDTQEDALVADFNIGSKIGVVVLADGMGGHNAGDVAANIVVSQVYAELRIEMPAMLADPESIPAALWAAANTANTRLKSYIDKTPNAKGMGCTLVGLVQIGTAIYWLSVGDSALYLLRDGELQRLNEDHSLAPQIDYMAEQGLITEVEARNHPDRSVLTSAMNGQPIRYADRREKAFPLRYGDTVIVASDGLGFLDTSTLVGVLDDDTLPTSAVKADALLKAIKDKDHANQDNVSFSIVQISDGQTRIKPVLHAIDGGAGRIPDQDEALRSFAMSAPEEPEKKPILTRLKSIRAGLIG